MRAFGSEIVSRLGPTLNPPCSITRRALEVLDSRLSSLIRTGAEIRPSASSLSAASATLGISSGSSPAARRRNSAAARSAASAPWYWATMALPSRSLVSLGLASGGEQGVDLGQRQVGQ